MIPTDELIFSEGLFCQQPDYHNYYDGQEITIIIPGIIMDGLIPWDIIVIIYYWLLLIIY
jgi:hypothetical protein